MLDSAIPEHLRQPRTEPMKCPVSFEPPYPSYSARFPKDMENLVMAVIGSQHSDASPESISSAKQALKKIQSFTSSGREPLQPRFQDLASVTDAAGSYNACVIAYWSSIGSWNEWKAESGFDDWWNELDREPSQHGWFLEVFSPSVDRVETISSYDAQPEGAAQMLEKLSGPVQEHTYWGSSRDRFPLAQTDPLIGEKWAPGQSNGSSATSSRIQIPGKNNLIVIRSTQDWSQTLPDERKLYEETMHPVLVKGMDFLRDDGKEVGCYSCRLMDLLNQSSMTTGTDRTFGLAYFDDLANLEKWSREHKTHLDIFGGFHRYAKKLENNISLRLYHEILVLKPEQQLFEYIACHPGTGMLNSL